jgi:hypothetical protein
MVKHTLYRGRVYFEQFYDGYRGEYMQRFRFALLYKGSLLQDRIRYVLANFLERNGIGGIIASLITFL